MKLEMCNECLDYKAVNEHGRCSNCEKEFIVNNDKNKLKDKMIEHLSVADSRGFKDKAMRLTIEEIKLIVDSL